MRNETENCRVGDEPLPTPHVLRAAIHVVRVIDQKNGTSEHDAHHAYTELPTGGLFQSPDLLAAESALLQVDLIVRRAGRLHPTTPLADVAALEEPEALEALLFTILERRPPLWLSGAVGHGEFRPEAIPDGAIALMEEVIPDLARREAMLLAAGRRYDEAALTALGALGEEFVVEACRAQLVGAGYPDLSERVRRVSLQSDQLGWDVDAPRAGGERRKLEVKTSRVQDPMVRFHLSRNEAKIGQQDPDWALVFCRADRQGELKLVGWCGIDLLIPLLPVDQRQNGRWESAVISFDEGELEPGLPPLRVL